LSSPDRIRGATPSRDHQSSSALERDTGIAAAIPPEALVSCILPVYNSEAFLSDAIGSILSQSYNNFELIIVNDGSTDGSGGIIGRFRDPRIRCVYQENSGIVAALNRGLSLAQGEFIARMDADDISLPTRFEKQVGYLIQNPDVVLVGGRSIPIDSNGDIDEDKVSKKVQRHEKRIATDFSTFPPKVATALHPLIMMRSAAIRAIGGYRHGFDYAEDYDMYIRISQYGCICNIEDTILKYRYHGTNISIKNTFDQEKNAALSELDNMRHQLSNLKMYNISQRTFDGYVQLRTFRREIGLSIFNYRRALAAVKLILAGAPTTAVRVSSRLLGMWLCNNARYLAKLASRPQHS
jgi:glycosyltransferase involved in cell wall biosynthesis